jgi:large subunit ribosomal protein L32
MAVPKKRTSRSRRGMRRAHDFLTFTGAVESCPNCSEDKLRHQMCLACGQYRGRQIVAKGEEAASAE